LFLPNGATMLRDVWSKLFALASTPGTPEEARDFLQRRLRSFFGVVSSVGWVFVLVGMTLQRVYFPSAPRFDPLRTIHLGITIASTVTWAWLRASPHPSERLQRIDAIGILFLTAGMSAMLYTFELKVDRPELEFVMALNVVLVARAALVPSTAGRTAFVGLSSAMLLSLGTLLYYRKLGNHRLAIPMGMSMAIALSWTLTSVGLTVVISRVIYGLQRRIEEVMRLGQYTLEEKIGEGAMGVVHRARHAMLRRPTAIKLLPPEKAGARASSRFEKEVQLTAKLTHPNTIAIYDYGRTPDGIFYYAMEYLDGVDMQRLVELDGPQDPARVVFLVRQVASALADAHTQGLIHRDVKPANVILCERGSVADFAKVVDFGLVKERDDGETGSDGIAGTPHYMSPESIRAHDDVDARSDLYALGAVAYFLLTGETPFSGTTVLEVCAAHLHTEVVPPSSRTNRPIPEAIDAIVLRCLKKNPEDRFASADALLEALSDVPGVEAWTQQRARAWWQTNGPLVRKPARRNEAPSHRTIGVDLANRTPKAS